MNDLALMLQGYLEAAFWSSTDDDGKSFEYRDFHELAVSALQAASDDCAMFLARCEASNINWWEDNPPHREHTIAEVLGHDFWLTRNGHGAGYWDGDWEIFGDDLTDVAKTFGETDLYVGDDGLLYFT